MPVQRAILVACGLYLVLLWALAVLPLLVVLYEFRIIELCRSISLGWFIATFYGSFFIYPFFVGGFATAALFLPLATAVSLVRQSRTAVWALLAFYVCTTAVIAYLEFFHSPRAVFEIAPGALDAHPNVISGLKAACERAPYPNYLVDLAAIIQQGSYSSYTRWAYYVGFVAQALIQNAIFVVFLIFIYFDKRRLAEAAPCLGHSITFILGYAIFLSAIWCLFQLTYRHEAFALFKMDNPMSGDYALVVLYTIVLTVFVVYFEFNLEKLAKTISTIGQLVAFVGGVVVLQLKQDQAHLFFGSQATIVNAFILFILFAFMTALALAFLLKPPAPSLPADT